MHTRYLIESTVRCERELRYAYARAGRLGEALSLLEHAVEHLSRGVRVATLSMVYLGDGYLLAGRSADATAMVDGALGLAVQRKELGVQSWALRLRGEIAAPVDLDAAEASYRSAIALAAELGTAQRAGFRAMGPS